MKKKIAKRFWSGILVSVLTLTFLTTLAAPALSHRRVVRRYYRGYYRQVVSQWVDCRAYYPATTIHRYHPRRGYDCVYRDGYWYHPYYGRHSHGHVGFGVRVVF